MTKIKMERIFSAVLFMQDLKIRILVSFIDVSATHSGQRITKCSLENTDLPSCYLVYTPGAPHLSRPAPISMGRLLNADQFVHTK
jgi:hypothetical protein